MNIVFEKGEVIEIVGIQRDCECFHCGRKLNIGVVLDGFGGAFGAQCISTSVYKQELSIGGTTYAQKLSSDAIKQRAIAAMRGDKNAHGWVIGSEVFRVTLKSDLKSI